VIKKMHMEHIFRSRIATTNLPQVSLSSIFSKFTNWCVSQESYRLGWLAGILAIHGCALTPITLFAVVLSGTNLALYISALVAMGLAVVTNLAAMPTKITIPAFFLSIVIDVAIIIVCIASSVN
jgi:hypothetical protein